MMTKNDVLRLAGCGEIYSIGYCNAQYLLMFNRRIGYNAGTYGWNYDVYLVGDDVIITGYRPFNAKRINYDLLKMYEDKARRVRYESGKNWPEITSNLLKELLRKNKELDEA